MILHFKNIIFSVVIAVGAPNKVQQKVSAFNLEQGKYLHLKKIFCIWQHQNFESSIFLKSTEIDGDCILYLNRQDRTGIIDTFCSSNVSTCNIFLRKFIVLDILKMVKPFLLFIDFRRILNYTEQMLKQMDTVFWKSGKNIRLENVMLLFFSFFPSE